MNNPARFWAYVVPPGAREIPLSGRCMGTDKAWRDGEPMPRYVGDSPRGQTFDYPNNETLTLSAPRSRESVVIVEWVRIDGARLTRAWAELWRTERARAMGESGK